MAKGYLIPNDWAGEDYHLWVFCAPASQDWTSVVRGAMYDLARGRSWDASTGSIQDTQEIAREMYDTMTICDDLVTALYSIETAITALNTGGSSCSCEGGSQLEETASDGEVDIGPGERFPDQATYDLAKCAASNGIYDTVKNSIDKLKIYDADTLGAGGVSLAIGLVTTLIASGPIGWGAAVALGVISGIVTLLLSNPTFDLNDVSQLWDDNHQDVVCEFYTANDADNARTNVLALLSGLGATAFELQFLEFNLNNTTLNQMYNEMTGDTQSYVGPNDIDCSVCAPGVGCTWVFKSVETGTGDLTKDGTERTLTSTVGSGGFHRIHIDLDTVSGSPGFDCDGEQTINAEYTIMSYSPATPSFTTHHPWRWNGEVRTNPGDWPNPPDQVKRTASELVLTDEDPFTMNIILFPGNFQG